jgi:hypothetical protein
MEILREDVQVNPHVGCLQRLEADSGQVEIWNSTPEEAQMAVIAPTKKNIPTLSKQ